jgi:hypothetical protein
VAGVNKPPVKQVKLPVIYEDAIRDLIICQTLDEAKYFADKAEALTAWARIYKNDQAGMEARRLKLHAYRRMGILAAEIQQQQKIRIHRGGWTPGPQAMLMESGLSKSQSLQARRLARQAQSDFDSMVNLPRPPTTTTAGNRFLGNSTQCWREFMRGPAMFKGFCHGHPAKTLARGLSLDESKIAIKTILAIQEWVDEFEQYIPKGDA